MDGKIKLVYLPLDERPCNYGFAAQIACGTPVELQVPALSLLGSKKQAADFAGIRSFLLEHGNADACVLSLDMLLYGGIVPSRLHHLELETLLQRLELLRQLKTENPKLRLYGFALIMRCPQYSSSDEEPDYYEDCGLEIFKTGQCKHKMALGLISPAEGEQTLAALAEKTDPWLADFEQRRNTNLAVLKALLTDYYDLFDAFVIPQDDSAPYGYTTMDRESLRQAAYPQVPMYPGADEVGMSLVSRAVCELMGKTPSVSCRFIHPDSPKVRPVYEDRPVGDTLPVLLRVSGCTVAQTEADIHLYLNYPAKDPVEVWDAPTEGYAMRDMESFCRDIAASAASGVVTALADGAYGNGGDEALMKLLSTKMDLTGLSAYAGWNTSSNTLGTAICQAVFVWLFGKGAYQTLFLAQRLYEDVGYCGHVRRQVTGLLEPLGFNYFDAGERDGLVAGMVRKHLQAYMQENFPAIARRYRIDRCQMPWKRMFEVDLTLQPEPFLLGTWHRPNVTGVETDLQGIQAVLDTFLRCGIRLVFLETIFHGMAVYKGGLLPYNRKLSGFDYGPYPDYLTAFTQEAAKRNIRVHAWVEVFYVGVDENIFTQQYPALLLCSPGGRIHHTEGAEYGGFLFLDPANPRVPQMLGTVYEDLLLRFPTLEGLNLDYIRYPVSDAQDDTGFTAAALDAFAPGLDREAQIEKTKAEYDSWVRFRAEKVTDFVSGIHRMVRSLPRQVALSTAVFPEQQHAFGDKKQDFSTWLARGYLDILTPMAYYDDDSVLQTALENMLAERGGCICYAGLSCTFHDLPQVQVLRQLQLARDTGCEGAVFFGSQSILEKEKYISLLEKINNSEGERP